MYGGQIDRFLNEFKENGSFLGVFAHGANVDFTINSYCVMNTANASEGSASGPFHWAAIGRFSAFGFELFDPQPLLISRFYYLMRGLPGSIMLNDQTLMPPHSGLCGQFVCYFLVKRQENLDLDFATLLNVIFTPDPEKNAEIVTTFMNSRQTN